MGIGCLVLKYVDTNTQKMGKSTLKDNRTIKRYSESFKQLVIRELSEGRLTKTEAIHKYGIGRGSLYHWMKKFSRLDLYNPKIRIEMPEEKDHVKAMEQRIKELEKALVNTQLNHLKSEADLAVALEMLGYTTKEEFEKKHGANQSKKR